MGRVEIAQASHAPCAWVSETGEKAGGWKALTHPGRDFRGRMHMPDTLHASTTYFSQVQLVPGVFLRVSSRERLESRRH